MCDVARIIVRYVSSRAKDRKMASAGKWVCSAHARLEVAWPGFVHFGCLWLGKLLCSIISGAYIIIPPLHDLT